MVATAEHIRNVPSVSQVSSDGLRRLIQTFPLIDNHAHNLLTEANASSNDTYPFELITSEARGTALTEHSPYTLAHIRGLQQLSEFFNCFPTLQDITAARNVWIKNDYAGLISKCLEGTKVILMDDGLVTGEGVVYPFARHEKFVHRVLRIVRIEAIAAELIQQMISQSELSQLQSGMWDEGCTKAFVERFDASFRQNIQACSGDPAVCAFKSVVCYRSGLAVGVKRQLSQHQIEPLLLAAFHKYLTIAATSGDFRIDSKAVNDHLVIVTCDVLAQLATERGRAPPFQFHTGLGDTDMTLLKSNPAYMQDLIETFPTVNFVLLHSSYPYTREAGYLAALFPNVWLDIGEVFPMLSPDGEESVLRQALELVPSSKILWSTDGHLFPETYWLANKQFRETLQRILLRYVTTGDITMSQAVNMALDIMFSNANRLYNLGEDARQYEFLQSGGIGYSSSSNMAESTARGTHSMGFPSRHQTTFDSFLQQNASVKYIWLQFLDYTGTMRVRMVPIAKFREHLSSGQYPSAPLPITRLLQNDRLAPGSTATGQFSLVPDLSTLYLNRGIDSPSATVQTWWMESLGESGPASAHLEGCPRWTLQKQVNALKSEFNIDVIMGFEIETIFMRPVMSEDGTDFLDFLPLHMVHSWSNMTTQQLNVLPMIEEIVDILYDAGIPIPHFHSEAAPGQWEFPLPAFEPLKAVDTLYRARDIIRNVAKKYGFRATLYPRPFDFTCGSASHAHFSINGPSDTVEKYQDPFLAGILAHLPSIMAFTLPIEESYARVMAGVWAGGEYITWGSQNREVPLRKCGPGHWELKTVDGIGNMYLSMAALVASGLHGLRENIPLMHKDCSVDASTVSQEVRAELGITTRLPNQLAKSLSALTADVDLCEMLGDNFIRNYIAVKRAECDTLNGMETRRRRVWLMSRY